MAQSAAHQVHTLRVTGSNPVPAPNLTLTYLARLSHGLVFHIKRVSIKSNDLAFDKVKRDNDAF